ncbi:hypothetical protein CsSME_00037597 [Camellia sinensis var. sinensis]
MPPFQMQPLAAYDDAEGMGDDVPITDDATGATTLALANTLAPVYMTRADYEALHHEHTCLLTVC